LRDLHIKLDLDPEQTKSAGQLTALFAFAAREGSLLSYFGSSAAAMSTRRGDSRSLRFAFGVPVLPARGGWRLPCRPGAVRWTAVVLPLAASGVGLEPPRG